MKAKTQRILSVMNVISWIVYIGLCIQTGAILISFFISLFFNPDAAKNLLQELNLFDLMQFNRSHYEVFVSLIILLSALKATIVYQVIKIFLKFNLEHPFSLNVAVLITKIGNLALATGILNLIVKGYCDWLIKQGATMPQDWGNAEFLLLAGIIFIIGQVFQKGIELQAENELTV